MSGDLLYNAPAPVTIQDEIRCIERELKFRQQVYPRLIFTGKMNQGSADREIRVMTAVLNRLKSAANAGAI